MTITTGTPNPTADVQVVDDTGLPVTGLVAATFPATSYTKGTNNAAVPITLVDLALITTAWTSGGVKERSGGYYRLDLPTAAVSTPATVKLIGEASGKRLICEPIDVTGSGPVVYVANGGSLTAVRDSITTGTIWVGRGTYTLSPVDCNLLKNGVDWHFEPGAVVTLASELTATLWIFDDEGSAVTSRITGHGKFVQDDTTVGISGFIPGILRTAHVDSVVLFEFDHAESIPASNDDDEGTAILCVNGSQVNRGRYVEGGTYTVRCNGGYQVNGITEAVGNRTTTFYCAGGRQLNTSAKATAFANDTVSCAGGSQINHLGYCEASIDTITCTGGTQVTEADHLLSTQGYGVYHSGGNAVLKARRIDAGSSIILETGATAGTMTITCERAQAGTVEANSPAVFYDNNAANKRLELLAGTYVSGSASTVSAFATTAQTLYVTGEVYFDKALDADVTVSRLLRQDLAPVNLVQVNGLGPVELGPAAGSGATAAELWAYAPRSLTSGVTRIVSPHQSGSMTVVQGDSYAFADGTQKVVSKQTGASWPTDLTGWTITGTIRPTTDTIADYPAGPSSVAFSNGAVVTATGTSQAVRLDLTATLSATLIANAKANTYLYDVQASNGAARSTLETGTLTVRGQQTTT